jgi:arginine/lysine/ornithine decarboxylase
VINVKIFIEAVGINEGVGHFNAFGFHGMFFGELILGDLIVVQVCDFVLHLAVNYL